MPNGVLASIMAAMVARNSNKPALGFWRAKRVNGFIFITANHVTGYYGKVKNQVQK
jgi:hypothetical protein